MLEGPDLDEVRRIAGGRPRALPVLGRDRQARRPRGPRRAAPGQPRRRDRRQGAVRAQVHGRRGPGRAGPGRHGALMHLKRVIPCLDVDAGRVVKGTNFVDIRDAGDPVELAERYDAEGADELVFLDITATHEKRDTMVELARRTADNVFIPFTIGGGIRSVDDAQAVLDAGRRQGLGQLGRGGAARADRRAGRALRRAVRRARDRRQGAAASRGRSTSPAGARRRAATPCGGRARASSAAPARSC